MITRVPESASRPTRRGRPPVPIATSPRIARLERDLEAGNPGAVEEFWAEVRELGTPLVEDTHDPDERIVTFLWRDTGSANGVVLFANKLFDRSRPERSRLRRVDGTDVLHLSHRLPADWRGSYHFAVDDGTATAGELRQPTPGSRISNALRSDPFNRDRLPHPPGPDKSVAALPAAPPQPYARPRPGGAPARLERHVMRSAELGNQRRVWIHVPDGSARTDDAELCIVLDGEIWVESIPLEPTLTNLAAARAIPPTITVFVESMPGAQRAAELCCHEPFIRFLGEELRPWVLRHHGVSARAEHTTLVGQSFGGVAALFGAWSAPQHFGRVLLQSASLWWGPPGRPERLTTLVRTSGVGKLQIYQEVGTDEGDNLDANRRLRDVLVDQDAAVTYHEFTGGHDRACWLGGLADGLRALAGAAAPT